MLSVPADSAVFLSYFCLGGGVRVQRDFSSKTKNLAVTIIKRGSACIYLTLATFWTSLGGLFYAAVNPPDL